MVYVLRYFTYGNRGNTLIFLEKIDTTAVFPLKITLNSTAYQELRTVLRLQYKRLLLWGSYSKSLSESDETEKLGQG